MLWQKVNALVDVLLEEPASADSKDVMINLTGRWNLGCQQRQSIFCPVGVRPDHDIVILPFSRLARACYYRLPAMLTASFRDTNWANNSLVSLMQANLENRRTEVAQDYLAGMERWMRDTAIFVETSLDTIQGPTANMLRLERFSNWFEDGSDSWKSRHSDWLLSNFPEHRDAFWRHDHLLRHVTLIMHHNVCGSVGSQPAVVHGCADGQSPIYEGWDAAAWYKMYPSGVPPLGTPSMREMLQRNGSFARLYEAEVWALAVFSSALASLRG